MSYRFKYLQSDKANSFGDPRVEALIRSPTIECINTRILFKMRGGGNKEEREHGNQNIKKIFEHVNGSPNNLYCPDRNKYFDN